MFTASQRQILRAIGESGPLSRTELTALLGLSKGAMSGLARELIDRGVIEETVPVYGQGRPSVLLDLRPQCAFFVGVSLLQDPAPVVLADLGGGIVVRRSLPLSRDPEAIALGIAAILPELVEGHEGAKGRLAGIGIALSGFVDEEQRACVESTLLGWQNVPLAGIVAARVDQPVFIENDAKAVAVSEKLFGEARDVSNFSLVSHGDGIGCAHFIDGRLYRGSHGGAGEIAHATIEPGGAPCRCGKRGCLDTVASMKAIREAARAEGLGTASFAELEREASHGNAAAIRVLHRAGSALGLAIASVIQINDPGLILVVDVEGSFDGLFGTVVRQAVEANVLPSQAGRTPLRVRRVDGDVWARGAAAIAAHRFLIGSNAS